MSLPPSSGSVQRHPRLEVVCLRRETKSFSNLHIRTNVRSRLLSYSYIDCDYQSVPLVLVFTQYDRLVRTKEFQLRETQPGMDTTSRRDQSIANAKETFERTLQSLKETMAPLSNTTYTKVSGIYMRHCTTFWY
jgi:hypothetical protein